MMFIISLTVTKSDSRKIYLHRHLTIVLAL